jgi:hypothetical protein
MANGGTGSRNPSVTYNKPSNPKAGQDTGALKGIAAGAVDSGDGPPQNKTGRYKHC